MTRKIFIAIVSFTVIFSVPFAESNEPQAGKPTLSKQMSDLTNRIVECNHWSGEEPYDATRSKQINDAIARLRCSDLAKDEEAMLKLYGANQEVVNAITEAKNEY